MDNKKSEFELKIWEKVVDVQMHFNDLCLRVRGLAVSILGVLLGASAISYRYAGSTQAATFILVAIIIWLSFYVMDRFWYHELLKGAVKHGKQIENQLKDRISSISLANSIREQSHSSLNMSAAKKLDMFYLSIATILIIAFFKIS